MKKIIFIMMLVISMISYARTSVTVRSTSRPSTFKSSTPKSVSKPKLNLSKSSSSPTKKSSSSSFFSSKKTTPKVTNTKVNTTKVVPVVIPVKQQTATATKIVKLKVKFSTDKTNAYNTTFKRTSTDLLYHHIELRTGSKIYKAYIGKDDLPKQSSYSGYVNYITGTIYFYKK